MLCFTDTVTRMCGQTPEVVMTKLLFSKVALISLLSAGVAQAADMPVRVPAPIAPPPFSWTGWYVGANVGFGWGHADTTFTPLPSAAGFVNLAPTTLSPDPNGVIGGGQIGYNWQLNRWVFGLEADFQGSNMHGSARLSPII